MGQADELEKIRQAEEWLVTEPEGSTFFNAARDHLHSAANWNRYKAVRAAARAAIGRWIGRNE
jgi:hypothetical protein